MFPTGEGAVSTGPLVAVHRPATPAEAESVIALLEAHHIPALSSAVVGSGWLAGNANPQVLVPATLRPRALDVLRRHGAPGRRRTDAPRAPAGSPWSSPAPSGLGVDPAPGGGARAPRLPSGASAPTLAPGRGATDGHPVDPWTEDPHATADHPTEPAEPVSGTKSWWAMLALLAVTSGVAMQVAIDGFWGPRSAVRIFGASARAWPELERWVTAGFVHGSSAHALGNALFGAIVAWATFQTHGVGATAFVWLASSAFGIAAQTTLHPEALVIGASAGNYGLVGLWARGQWERSRRRALPRRERLRTFGILLLLVPGAFTPFTSTGAPVAVAAHALGFCGGALAGAFFNRRLAPEDVESVEQRSTRAGWFAAGTAALAFTLALGRAAAG